MNRRQRIPIFGTALALRANAQDRMNSATASPSVATLSAEQAARKEDFWFQVRHAFTVERNFPNFNNGSLCPAHSNPAMRC